MTQSKWADFPCKLVITSIINSGYATITIDGKTKLAHRHVLEQKLGRPIYFKHQACHYCDVKNCIEPEHLYEGTQSDNVQDCVAKGRHVGWGGSADKTHCPEGHPLSGANLYTWRGHRACKICMRAADKRYREKKRVG
jgi:hypothetical protein